MKRLIGLLALIFLLTGCGNSGAPRLTEEQRIVWDLIEERIEQGYEDWVELVLELGEQGIAWNIVVDGEISTDELMDKVWEFGVVGNYIEATPGFGRAESGNEDEIILLLHYDDLTFNEDIVELSRLDRLSEEDLDNWLDPEVLARLEKNFATVEVTVLDENGEPLQEGEYELEFISWDFTNTGLLPFERSSISITKTYRIVGPSPEEVQEMIINALNEMDNTTSIPSSVRSSNKIERGFAHWIGLDSADFSEVDLDINFQKFDVNSGGSINAGPASSSFFVRWEYETRLAENGRLTIEFQSFFDTNLDSSGAARPPREGQSALNRGREYLRTMSFSPQRLAEQLEWEGFPTEAVRWAMEQLEPTVDWYAQAVDRAEGYVRVSSFSRARLIDQLVWEGFTHSQAEHGADAALEE